MRQICPKNQGEQRMAPVVLVKGVPGQFQPHPGFGGNFKIHICFIKKKITFV
jgi:hypothetical protein